jgi:hypothetical protein
MRRMTAVLGLVALLFGTGCNVTMPQLFRPGHGREQQLRATFHDPYGNTNMGPEILGGRPIDYLQPRPQPVQTQWFFDR